MVIFLYGADAYRSKRKLDEIVAKFRADHDKSGMNTVALDADKTEPGELGSALSATPFLGLRRMVVVRGLIALKKAEQEGLQPIVESIPDSTVAVFYERLEEAACKKSVFWKQLTAGKFNWEFSPLAGAKLSAWIQSEAEERGVTFAPPALAAFTEAVGGDSARAANELAKLAAYIGASGASHEQSIPPLPVGERVGGEGRKIIELADVALLVSDEVREDMFGFLDAVAAKQPQRAVILLEQQIAAGTEPMQILAMLGRTVRLLLMSKDLLDRGVTQDETIRTLGVHPYAAKKSLAQARSLDMNTLRGLHTALLDADWRIKTGSASSPRVALDLLVAKAVAA